ncbi:MAG: hypothetical protein C0600_05845 [Ignavibacteria bacterium]|nr:MAG: hypothetical protein C0600_05845 [Ignavibacteria bacterium]
MALCLHNLGDLYVRQSHGTGKSFYAEALEHLQKSLRISEKRGDRRSIANTTGAIGGVHLELEQYSQALSCFQRRLDLTKEMGERERVAESLGDIGWCRYKMGHADTALTYLHRSLALAEELGAADPARQSLSRLHAVYAARGDYERAYAYYQRSTAHTDSLQDEKSRQQLNELLAEHEAKQKENKIALLEKNERLQAMEQDRLQDALDRHRLESLQRTQEVKLLASEHEIQQLELDRAAANLARQKVETELQEQDVATLRKDRELQSSKLERETLIRNGAIAAFVLLLLFAVLVYRRIRDRRRSSELRAEAAEYKARAAEAQSLATVVESERRERKLQQQYSRRLLEAQETERKRMAGELHDSIGQEALVIKNRIRRAMNRHDPGPELKSDLEKTVETSSLLLEDIRRITRNLRPMQLERSGLTETLRDLVQQLRESTPLTVDAHVDDIDGVFSQEREMDVYRIVQEGLNNTIRHSDADAVHVRIQKDNGTVRIEVSDDGKGFDLAEATLESKGLGLQGISERVQMLGGKLHVETAPGAGTQLTASLPHMVET